MAILFEILLLIGFAGASFYICYRNSTDFQQTVDKPYKLNYQKLVLDKTKELDKVFQQIEEAKQIEKKKLLEKDSLKAKSKDKVLSDQEFNNFLDE
ncbi:unnamed protein product [Paramecium pentaurelia]|uniref:ATP synthase F0 subunit 8 n=1 Tax=Paramecium pentaurelia TaxID=43138 RepID=A0A8S1V359_9CILI|nr:unnamed protein product [Paramecium pentaurelia]